MLSEKTEQTDRSFGSGIAAGAVAKDPAFDPVRLSVNLVCSGNPSAHAGGRGRIAII
jgi:hypothetical protein